MSFLLLVVFAYVKNRVLSTSELGRRPGKKGSVMGKTKFILGSVSEVVVALGASLLASVWPLSQANFAPDKEMRHLRLYKLNKKCLRIPSI